MKEKGGISVRNGKRGALLLLAVCLLVGALLPSAGAAVSAAEDTFVFQGKSYRRSEDVPAIYIENVNGLNVTSYVSCTVVAVDAVGGKYDPIADTNATVRIRGNSTSSGAKKPYNIKFSSKTNLFGMGKGKKYCLIANLYDPTLIRNHAAFDFARDIGLKYTPDSMLVDVYFNGVYGGCYQLCEAISAGSGRVDIDVDDGDFIIERDARDDPGRTYFYSPYFNIHYGINEPDDTTPAQARAVQQKVREAEEALISNSYEQVCELFDIPSLVDEYIVLELFKNVDVDCASTRFYCKDGKIYGGPVWDFDLSSGNCDLGYYYTYNFGFFGEYTDSVEGIWVEQYPWFGILLGFTEFRDALCERYLALQDVIVNLYDDTLRGQNYIDRTVSAASGSIARNWQAGWDPSVKYEIYMRIPDATYEQNVEYFRDWLRRRNEWLLAEWGLTDRVAPKPIDPSLSYDGEYLVGLAPETTVASLSSLFSSRVVCDAEGALVATGDRINGGGRTYALVVSGDLSRDGRVNVVDYLMLRRALSGSYTLDDRGEYLAACVGYREPCSESVRRVRAYCRNGTPLSQ